ncbi:MAG: NAD(P)H-binding protein [Pseudonocardiales bacterium]|nr:NAD(P)H-binding protein [Pseudonocardiales bacterium]
MVQQALSRGHNVVAVVRRPDALALTDERLSVRQGDVLDPDSIARAIEGSETVISALGSHTRRTPTTIYSEGISNIVAALPAADASRLIAISAAPTGPWSEVSTFERLVVYPLLEFLFGASYDDMRRMEGVLAHSEVDWTIFRPPRLTDREAKGNYRTSITGALPRAYTITRGDLATAILDSITDDSLVRRFVAIAN